MVVIKPVPPGCTAIFVFKFRVDLEMDFGPQTRYQIALNVPQLMTFLLIAPLQERMRRVVTGPASHLKGSIKNHHQM
jgi:hypothetical protein